MQSGKQRDLLLEHISMGHLLAVEASTAHRMRAKMAVHVNISEILFLLPSHASLSEMDGGQDGR
jgi:hypothetical protein